MNPEMPEKSPKTTKKARKPSESVEIRTNYQALQETLEEMRQNGQLGRIDEARIQICLGLAAAVDSMPDNSSLWREYRAAESALRKEAIAHGDPFDQLIASLQAEVRDEKKQEEPHPRTRGGGHRP